MFVVDAVAAIVVGVNVVDDVVLDSVVVDAVVAVEDAIVDLTMLFIISSTKQSYFMCSSLMQLLMSLSA